MTETTSQASPEVHIQLAKWLRVYLAVFGTFWVSALIAMAILAGTSEGILFAVMPLLMIAYGGTMMYRSFRLELRARGDLLVVRNLLSTKTFDRSQIEGFRVGRFATHKFKAVHLLLQGDDMLMLHATMQMPPWGKRRYGKPVAELNAWLEEGLTVG